MNRDKRIVYFEKLCSNINNIDVQIIENSLIMYIINKNLGSKIKTPEYNINGIVVISGLYKFDKSNDIIV